MSDSIKFIDEYGNAWYDNITMHSDTEGQCFMCQRPTHKIDVAYVAYYCGSFACDQAIRADLERLNPPGEGPMNWFE